MVPVAVVLLVMVGAPDPETVKVRVAVPVALALDALIVTDEVPAEDGVPEIRPVFALTDKPEGNPEAPKLVGELEAAI